jgi:hypothetical protein
MQSDDKSQKPMPTAAEINAYLELSAARTKKRLTLAAGNAAPLTAPQPRDRKLRLTGSAGGAAAPAPAALEGVVEGVPEAPAARGEPSWSPFPKDPKA